MFRDAKEQGPRNEDAWNRAFLGFIGGLVIAGEMDNIGIHEPVPVGAGVIGGILIFKGLKIVKGWLSRDEQ